MSEVGFHVRAGRVSDAAQLCELINEIIEIGGTTANQVPYNVATFEQAYFYRTEQISLSVVESDRGLLLGFQYLGRNADLPEYCADIATFARQSGKVRGVGTALFVRSCDVARKNGFGQINATIRADNVPGLAYYSKMGFADYTRRKDVPLSDGTLVDRISKRYNL